MLVRFLRHVVGKVGNQGLDGQGGGEVQSGEKQACRQACGNQCQEIRAVRAVLSCWPAIERFQSTHRLHAADDVKLRHLCQPHMVQGLGLEDHCLEGIDGEAGQPVA